MDIGSRVNHTANDGTTYNAVYTDKKKEGVKVEDFLNMMVQQLSNQDFMNPVDDTQYLSQMAQFATMQQMQELGEYSKSNYAMSMLGKTVTVASIGMNGDVKTATAKIDKVSLVDGEYTFSVAGKTYTMDQVMEVHRDVSSEESAIDVSDKTIEVSDLTKNSANFSWPAATTNTAITNDVKYSVYYSTNKEFDSVEQVEANGFMLGSKDRTELTSESIKGLEPGTTYYINVVVTDPNNVKSVYQKAVFKTKNE